jgi:hypothetical protein
MWNVNEIKARNIAVIQGKVELFFLKSEQYYKILLSMVQVYPLSEK